MEDTLIIIPCAKTKIWETYPNHCGPAPARDAYTSDTFRKNRVYAERFSTHWRILSAKYGFIEPDFLIPESYNVTFIKPSADQITVPQLRSQVHEQGLDRFALVIALGGKAYAGRVRAAFLGTRVRLKFPYLGLPVGKAKAAVRAATAAGDPFLPYRASNAATTSVPPS